MKSYCASDASPDTFDPNLNLSMTEFSYDLSTNRRITPGVLTEISLSASNSIGSSDYSDELSVTIAVPGNAFFNACEYGWIVIFLY